MAGQDKAAVAYSIAVTAIFLGITAAMGASQDTGPTTVPPVIEKEMIAEPSMDDFDYDGIPSIIDDCPKEPETINGFQDEDGCPDQVEIEEEIMMEESEEVWNDVDYDGIEDWLDECPTEAETFNEITDEDGCPDGTTFLDKLRSKVITFVEIPVGTLVPGCEETNECYSPADITINAGFIVEWMNIDSAIHTVTAGTPADAQMGVFHSDLIMPGDNWENTFDDAGSYDYFCMVHPWMVGTVTVN